MAHEPDTRRKFLKTTSAAMAGAAIILAPPILMGTSRQRPGPPEVLPTLGWQLNDNVRAFADASLQYSSHDDGDGDVDSWRWLFGVRFQHWPEDRWWGSYAKTGLLLADFNYRDRHELDFVAVGAYGGVGASVVVGRSTRPQWLCYFECVGGWATEGGDDGTLLLGELGIEYRY